MPDAAEAAAYVCVGRACGLPVRGPAALAERLDGK
jgi:uncharacterized protein YyaL (SSP411 family)